MPPDSLGLAKTVRLTFQIVYTIELSGPYSHSSHFKQLGSEGTEKIVYFIYQTPVLC